MADEMQISMPEGVLRPIIQAQVVAALNGQPQLIAELVKYVMTTKIRDKNYQEYSLLDHVCRETLTKAIQAAVREWVESQKTTIQEEVAGQLRKRAKSIATQLVASMTDVATSSYRLAINVQVGAREQG
jgi:hypothetical protein